ncbi:ribosomal protein S19 binding protein 1 [Synchiropus splendidus]|uniref:ribosomal protein S19 binding protein 1 n=1 Tax=Synchiropus splendidus TaxID=270530 RepID=UPI00237DDA4A|nr:ribosomal protein S19 binding protein 1 [Synchiropus splendidus]
MSLSLLKRGLALLGDDIRDESKGKKKPQKQTPSSATVMDHVSTKRQGVTRQVKRLQGRLGPGKSKATVKDKHVKSAIDEFRKNQKKSCLNENLRYFMATTHNATVSDAQKIQNHIKGRQSRKHPTPPASKPKKPKSLFSEEEFQQFQKEYFGKLVEETR